ncbi:MAG: TonB-dependent receptor [Bacteroidota bacterium]
MKNHFKTLLALSLFWGIFTSAMGQTTVQGKVFDEISGENLIGVQVYYEEDSTVEGTITNEDGYFDLEVSKNPPLELYVEFVGYQARKISVEEIDQYLEIYLTGVEDQIKVQSLITENEIQAVSKVNENRLITPVSVEKMGILEIQELPTRDFHAGIGYMKGIFVNNSSLTYHSLNTRAFANLQNWRFVQLIDGMDISGPGVNYGVGSVMKGSELDIRSIEVVPGPGSALYGPNAFNGLLSMITKNPFDYQGVSAYVKQGMINRPNGDTQPLTDLGIRYALRLNDKLAFKVNATYFTGNDFISDDRNFLITNQEIPFQEQLLQTSPLDPNFNAVNVYGDETQVQVDLGTGELVPINRSGIPERELLNYEIDNLFLQGSVHFRPNDKLEASYDIRYSRADNIIRYENFYPFKNFQTLYQKLELRSDNFFARVYHAKDESGDGFSVLSLGAILQEAIKPTQAWGEEYGAAFRGEVNGIQAGNHVLARGYADRDIPNASSSAFQQAKAEIIGIPIDQPGGAGVVMEASFLHGDLNYDFKNEINFLDLQVGGSYRLYRLASEGHVYSDGPLGFNEPIPTWEYGGYIQAAKNFVNERLTLKSSLRYDKNKNFTGRFTPRVSTVLTLGKQRKSSLRASWQTGFRNPANQDTYVAFNAGPLIYLGNIQDNIENYSLRTLDGTIISGEELYQNLVTTPSFTEFVQSGGTDPSILQPANLRFLEQEQITTYEVGFRSLFARDWLVDATFHRNTYKNFTANILSFSPAIGMPILTLNNVEDPVYSTGFNLGIAYNNDKGWRFGGNYNFVQFDADDARERNPFYFPDFNTPQNSFKVFFGYRSLQKKLGFNVHYRWVEDYVFQSPNGQGLIESFGILDGAILYRIPKLKSLLKLGATNITNDGYRTVYGGPLVGGEYYLQWTFDSLFRTEK